ncbi:MAG: hypothetical protein ACLQVI_41615, partial [Polyangiaceae bacterium]
FRWYSFADAVVDGYGNIFCAGEDAAQDKFVVWCMGPDFAVRWIREGLDFDDSNARLALDVRGRLLLWQSGRASVTVISAADGSTVGKLGGREPDEASIHYLDVTDGKQLMVDVDGTILALLGERLVRFGEDGAGRPTWPPRAGLFGMKTEKPRPLYGPGHSLIDVDGVYVENVGHAPTEIDDYTRVCVGMDGRLYLERAEWVACFDRAGERIYRLKLPADSIRGHRMGTDRSGRLYVLAQRPGDPPTRLLLRVAPDGSRADLIASDHRAGGVLGNEDHLVVLPDGTIVLLDYGGQSRVLGPDGRLLSISDKSREKDEEERKELSKRE